jgi:hypothetical protein
MRFLLRMSFPIEAENASAKKDCFKTIHSILQKQKPEAAYFLTQDGKRIEMLILDVQEASQMTEFCEPWFLALNAQADWSPVMLPSDLQKAAPGGESRKELRTGVNNLGLRHGVFSMLPNRAARDERPLRDSLLICRSRPPFAAGAPLANLLVSQPGAQLRLLYSTISQKHFVAPRRSTITIATRRKLP